MAGANALGQIALLSHLQSSDLEELERRCRWRRFDKGEQILGRDSDNRDIYFVVEGSVGIVNFSLSGREVAYAVVEQGGYFGELAAVDGQPRSANVVANESCRLAALSPRDFHEMLLAKSDISLSLLQQLASIIRACDERIMDLATLGAVQRVMLEIVRLATPDPVNTSHWWVKQLPTQNAIAAQVGTTRETVARVFGNLTQSGLIERKGRMLLIRDKGRLEILANNLVPGKEEKAR